MRGFCLVLSSILLASTISLAQHHSGGGGSAPSSPSSSSSPSFPSSPSPSMSSGSSSSSSSSAGSHSSPAPSTPSSAPSPSHAPSSPVPSVNNSPASHPIARDPDVDAKHIVIEPKNPVEPVKDVKTAEPDLRHRICEGANCPEKEPRQAEHPPVDSELRHRICLNGKCQECSAADAKAGKCGGTAFNPNEQQNCSVNESWNGSTCISRCSSGMTWNGFSCSNLNECASVNGRSAALADEIRMAKERMKRECTASPSSSECESAKIAYGDAVERYRLLRDGTTSALCRGELLDPLTI